MLERARESAAGSTTVVGRASSSADAQTHAFIPAPASTRSLSRFGVMFFADPIAAFANLRRALRRRWPARVRVLAGGDREPRGCWCRSVQRCRSCRRRPAAWTGSAGPVRHSRDPIASRQDLAGCRLPEPELEPVVETLRLGGGGGRPDTTVGLPAADGTDRRGAARAPPDPTLMPARDAAVREGAGVPYVTDDGVRMSSAKRAAIVTGAERRIGRGLGRQPTAALAWLTASADDANR